MYSNFAITGFSEGAFVEIAEFIAQVGIALLKFQGFSQLAKPGAVLFCTEITLQENFRIFAEYLKFSFFIQILPFALKKFQMFSKDFSNFSDFPQKFSQKYSANKNCAFSPTKDREGSEPISRNKRHFQTVREKQWKQSVL